MALEIDHLLNTVSGLCQLMVPGTAVSYSMNADSKKRSLLQVHSKIKWYSNKRTNSGALKTKMYSSFLKYAHPYLDQL